VINYPKKLTVIVIVQTSAKVADVNTVVLTLKALLNTIGVVGTAAASTNLLTRKYKRARLTYIVFCIHLKKEILQEFR